jgi:adenine-specific DNA-methyltransferase
MRSNVFKFLKSYSTQPYEIDRLIVSAFLEINKINITRNKFIKSYIISNENNQELYLLNVFVQILKEEFDKFEVEELIKLFEFVISPSDKIVTGAVYTPSIIREYIVKQILDKTQQIDQSWLTCDLACGCGGFLYTIAEHLKSLTQLSYQQIYENHIVGLDIQQYAINRTKILLSILAIMGGEDIEEFKFNLYVGDALNFEWENCLNCFSGFNCILGNPPYVCSRKIELGTKQYLSKFEVCSTGHPDLYIPFFQVGLELLKQNGFLGYITMNSFFKSLNGRALRSYLENRKLYFQILDFGTSQVFQKRSTYTCICLIQNINSDHIEYARIANSTAISVPKRYSKIPYKNLRSYNGWNLQCSDTISKIESIGTPFHKRFKTRNGIATLKNDIYIFNPVKEDDNYYYLQNGSLYQIEKKLCKEVINPNKFTTHSNLGSIVEKIIFPYEFVNGKAKVLSELQMEEEYPFALKYLQDKKDILSKRDRGNGKYPNWFAFGRTQCLEKLKYKLFFPHITPHTPNYVINANENLLFYNGIAVIGDSELELEVLSKLMSSRLFWFYISNTSKPYSAGYFSLSKNYIKDFGVPDFTSDDLAFIINEHKPDILDAFFEKKYGIELL